MKNDATNRSAFANRLVQLRHLSGMKQREMAEHLNLDRSTYTYYENDKTRPDFQTLIRIARMFNVSVDFLLGLTESERSVSRVASSPNTYDYYSSAAVLSALEEDEQSFLILYRQLDVPAREDLLKYVGQLVNRQYDEG